MSGYDPYNSSRVRMEQERLNPRQDHKTAESQWRGMSAQDRNKFAAPQRTVKKKGMKLQTVCLILMAILVGVALYTTNTCQPEVRCAD